MTASDSESIANVPSRRERRISHIGCVATFGAAALAIMGVANADIIYTDLGTGGSYDTANSYLIGGRSSFNGAQATQFVNSSSAKVSVGQIDLGLASLSGSENTQVSLWSANGDALGRELDHWSVTIRNDGAMADQALTSINNISGITLNAGGSYFLQVAATDASSLFTWNFNDVGAVSRMIATNPTAGQIGQVGIAPAFQLQGSPIVTPLPGSTWLALSGLGLLMLLSRRNSTQAHSRPDSNLLCDGVRRFAGFLTDKS